VATGTHIVIDNMVYQKIMHWVNKSNYEVSGLGKITYEKGCITVIDAMLFPQKNGSAHTDIEGEHVAKAMYLLKDTPGDLRWWWHSHVNMDVFWSGTDRDTIDKISEGGWFAATVFNKRHEMKSCLNMNTPLPLGMIDNIPTQAIQFLDPELIKAWDADYEKNVDNMMKGYSQYPNWGGHYREKSVGSGRNEEQLLLPGTGSSETWGRGDTSAADDYTGGMETNDDNEIKPMSADQVQDYLERAQRRGVPKSGPPSGPNGETGGW
jgi:hypothetical protein